MHKSDTQPNDPPGIAYADRDLAILHCIQRSEKETGEGPKKEVMIAELPFRWPYTCAALRRLRAMGFVHPIAEGRRDTYRLTEQGRLRLHYTVAIVVTDSGHRWAMCGTSNTTVDERIEMAGDLLGEEGTAVLQPIEILPRDRRSVTSAANLPRVGRVWRNHGQVRIGGL